MSEPANCIIMRRQGDRLQTRGPMAEQMTAAEAFASARALGRQYRDQTFVVLQEIAVTEVTERVSVRKAPNPPKLVAGKEVG